MARQDFWLDADVSPSSFIAVGIDLDKLKPNSE